MGWVLQTAPVALEVFCLASPRVSKIWVWSPGKPSLPSVPDFPPLSVVFSPTCSPISTNFVPLKTFGFEAPASLELSVVCYKNYLKWEYLLFFFFSVSASNRVIHMSSCNLPLCFVYQTSYGMKRKVRDWWDLFWKKIMEKKVSNRNGINCLKILGRGTTHWAPSTQQSLLGMNENLLA